MATIMRYPHGWNWGGMHQMHTCPSLTISGWQSNNFIIDTYMTDYSEIELKPDSTVTPLGNCQYDIDGRTIEFKIRKLTVRECMRLMDVPENVIDKILQKDENGKQIISNSQGYKLAGNSIVVSCLYYLFEQIWYPKEPTSLTPKQLTLF